MGIFQKANASLQILALIAAHLPATPAWAAVSTINSDEGRVNSAGVGGIQFDMVPVDVRKKCASQILKGTDRFKGTAFVLPRAFVSIDREGNTMFEIVPLSRGRYLLRFGLFFPHTDETYQPTSDAGRQRRDKSHVYLAGCDLDAAMRAMNENLEREEDRIRRIAPLPIKSLMIRIDGLNDVYRIGSPNNNLLELQGKDHVVEFKIPNREVLNEILNRLTGRIGLNIQVELFFSARQPDGVTRVTVDTTQIATAVSAELGGRIKVTEAEFKTAISNAAAKTNMRVYSESSSSEAYNDFAQKLISQMLQEAVGVFSEETVGGDEPASKGGGSGSSRNDSEDEEIDESEAEDEEDDTVLIPPTKKVRKPNSSSSKTGFKDKTDKQVEAEQDPLEYDDFGRYPQSVKPSSASASKKAASNPAAKPTAKAAPKAAPKPAIPRVATAGVRPRVQKSGTSLLRLVNVSAAVKYLRQRKTMNLDLMRLKEQETMSFQTATLLRGNFDGPGILTESFCSTEGAKLLPQLVTAGTEVSFFPVDKQLQSSVFTPRTSYFTLNELDDAPVSFPALARVEREDIREKVIAGAGNRPRAYFRKVPLFGSAFEIYFGKIEMTESHKNGPVRPIQLSNNNLSELNLGIQFSALGGRIFKVSDLLSSENSYFEASYDDFAGKITISPKRDLGNMIITNLDSFRTQRVPMETYFQERIIGGAKPIMEKISVREEDRPVERSVVNLKVMVGSKAGDVPRGIELEPTGDISNAILFVP